MSFINFLKKTFLTPVADKEEFLSEEEALSINFKVIVIEFLENIEYSSGEILTALLKTKNYLSVSYFNEPFNKSFLNLEGRTFFDFIDKGQAILDTSKADVIIWGYRENNKIRLNFQTAKQYEKNNTGLISLLDSLYLPTSIFEKAETFPSSVLNLIAGAIIASINTPTKQLAIQQKYLLKKIIHTLSSDNSAKSMPLEFMPYIMNFLSIIYLTYCQNSSQSREYKIVDNLLNTATQHQDLIKEPVHLGCIYNHIGQLHNFAAKNLESNPSKHFKTAISYYQRAQKYLGKYTYPYDYGFISFKLADLLYSYWRQKEDMQALRDSVFNLREAEKIFTYTLFPEFWADIEGLLGHHMGLLGSLAENNAISELAIEAYTNQQKIIPETRDPFAWAQIQENIGNLYYQIGRKNDDRNSLEESLEYFHEALYIFENMELADNTKRLMSSIAKSSDLLL
ncbi:MAG: hypothetical protein MJ210_01795 [Alphaproteobacteria bacterium]|nr:hypothetical protein [Alphaproteobacteria bacterium]